MSTQFQRYQRKLGIELLGIDNAKQREQFSVAILDDGARPTSSFASTPYPPSTSKQIKKSAFLQKLFKNDGDFDVTLQKTM